MFTRIKNVWKTKEIRSKVLFTLLIITLFMLGGFIPIPFVSTDALRSLADSTTLFGLFNLISGGNFGNFTIFSMSITPYINASIVFTVFTFFIPKFKEIAKEGEEGRKKLEKYTIVLAMVLAVFQSALFIYSQRSYISPCNVWTVLLDIALLTGGVALLIHLANLITKKGIGNGISVIIFTGILSQIPANTQKLITYAKISPIIIAFIAIMVVVFLALMGMVVAINDAEKRVPINTQGGVAGGKMMLSQKTYLPVKPNVSGVIPIIFASTIALIPSTIAALVPGTGYANFISKYFAWGGIASTIVYMLLIFLFTYVYTILSFNVYDIAQTLKSRGHYIQGIRPGRPTAEYLAKVMMRLTFFSALFLCILAVIPNVLTSVLGFSLGFAGTSLIIIVSVALEVHDAVDYELEMQGFRSLLKGKKTSRSGWRG